MTDNLAPANTPSRWECAVQQIRGRAEFEQLVRDAYYDDPASGAAKRFWQSEEWSAVREFLPPGRGLALDVGAGRGIASYALAREGFSVTALEPDRSAIVGSAAIRSLAQESDLPIEVVEAFSEHLPFADRQFDLVFARAVLHHTRDLQTACAEYFRVLKPGGCLLGLREHVISRPADLEAFFEAHPLHRYYGGEKAFTLDQYVQALVGSGLTLTRVLAPLDSAINYAPHTQATLIGEIADRVGQRVPHTGRLVERLLRLRPLWALARAALRPIDHRPGRLYSFIAYRPER